MGWRCNTIVIATLLLSLLVPQHIAVSKALATSSADIHAEVPNCNVFPIDENLWTGFQSAPERLIEVYDGEYKVLSPELIKVSQDDETITLDIRLKNNALRWYLVTVTPVGSSVSSSYTASTRFVLGPDETKDLGRVTFRENERLAFFADGTLNSPEVAFYMGLDFVFRAATASPFPVTETDAFWALYGMSDMSDPLVGIGRAAADGNIVGIVSSGAELVNDPKYLPLRSLIESYIGKAALDRITSEIWLLTRFGFVSKLLVDALLYPHFESGTIKTLSFTREISIQPETGPKGTQFVLSYEGFGPNSLVTAFVKSPSDNEYTIGDFSANENGGGRIFIKGNLLSETGAYHCWMEKQGSKTDPITFTVTDSDITINHPPVAIITGSIGNQQVIGNEINISVDSGKSARVNLTAAKSFDPDSSISRYEWQINGELKEKRDIIGSLGAGNHRISLTVTDSNGLNSEQASLTIDISEQVSLNIAPQQPPQSTELGDKVVELASGQIGQTYGSGIFEGVPWVEGNYTYCDRFVSAVLTAASGKSLSIPYHSGYNTAFEHYLTHYSLVKQGSPPKGTIVYYGRSKVNNEAGHVGIADGSGNLISVLDKTRGVDKAGLNQMGAPLLGWIYPAEYYVVNSTPTAAGPSSQITGVSPTQPTANPSRQWITIFGSGFVSQAQVTLRISGIPYVIPADRTQFVNSSQIKVYAGLTDPGSWSAQVTNPGVSPSNIYYFQVIP